MLHHLTGNGESDPHVAAGSRKIAVLMPINCPCRFTRAPRISWIDSGVGLDEIFIVHNAHIGSPNRADDAHGDGLIEAKRIAHRQDQLSDLKIYGIAPWQDR